MNFYCKREKLSEAVSIVQKAVASSTTMPILSCILIETHKDMLKLAATDLNMGIETYIEADILEEGRTVISAKIFSELTKKLPDNDVHIKSESENITVIKSGISETKLKSYEADEFPEIPYIEEIDPVEISMNKLKNMIRQTVFSVSSDESRPNLTGSLFEVEDNNLYIVALDGYRLALRKGKISRNNKDIKAIIPGKTLNEIIKIIPASSKNISIIFADNQILFDMGYTRINSRILEGEFINYKSIINPSIDDEKEENNMTRVKAKAKSLLESIERASLMAQENSSNLIKFQVSDDRIIITSNSNMGNIHEEVNVNIEGNDITIAFNSRYLLESLRAIEEEYIFINFTTDVSPCIINPVNGDNFLYLILPVRLN